MRIPAAFPRKARWAVPAGAVAVVAVAGTVSAITVAQAAPALPARTPAQLLAAVAGAKAPPPLTGTVVETAGLGIPQLPGADNPTSIASLLSGSHTLKIWYADPTHIRLSAPVTMGESDLIRNGSTVWFWQSSTNSVTKLFLPPRPARQRVSGEPFTTPLTPQQAAQQALAAVGKTTYVTTETNVTVAGQPAYQLVLAPKDSRSLVGKVTIAVDGDHPAVPLRVQVFARGAKSPALSVGYTSISFVRPAAANFQFTPPKGAHVTTVPGAGGYGWRAYAPLSGQKFIPPRHNGWSGMPPMRVSRGVEIKPAPGGRRTVTLPNGHSVTVRPGAPVTIKLPNGHSVTVRPGPAVMLPGGHAVFMRPGMVHAWACVPPLARREIAKLPSRAHASATPAPVPPKIAKLLPLHTRGHWAAACRGKLIAGQVPGPPVPLPSLLAPQVIGKGWLSVAVLPQSVLGGLGSGNAASAAGQAARSVAGSGGPVGNAAIVAALLKAAQPVHGSWGSGRLLHTSLISVLITNGHVLVGAVTPAVLYADASQIK